MVIILTKIRYCYKMSNLICLDFSQDFQILFPPGQFKRKHEKTFKKKQFSVKILARFLPYGQLFNSKLQTLKY